MLIALAQVLEVGPRDKTQALVLMCLADHADENGLSWPSIKRIAHIARCSESGVRRALSILVETGWLLRSKTWHRLTGVQMSNRYRINIRRLSRLAAEAAAERKLPQAVVEEFGLFEDECENPSKNYPVMVTPSPCHGDTLPLSPRQGEGVMVTPEPSTETPKEPLDVQFKIDLQKVTAFERDEIFAGRSVILHQNGVQVLPHTGLATHLRRVLRK